MNYWTPAPVPTYSVGRSIMRKTEKAANSSSDVPPPPPPPKYFARPSDPSLQEPANILEFFEPAVEGPPSPESIRALSKQMRTAIALDSYQSHQNSHQSSHQTTSSGSSSLQSSASAADRPSWEHAAEGPGLSRKSSGRSTTSSMPSRERPDSVQIFGKVMFNRRGKQRRESGLQSSSGSFLGLAEYPGEMSAPPPPPPPPPSATGREQTLLDNMSALGLFSRRRVMKPDQNSSAKRKIQISGPYNFQHVTHTPKDDLASVQQANRTAGSLRGNYGDELQLADLSTDSFPMSVADERDEDDEPYSGGRLGFSYRPSFLPKRGEAPRRLAAFLRPTPDTGRIPPPRPPRSPVEYSAVDLLPPIPPPRVSSRVSVRADGFDPASGATLTRPQTSGGFRYQAASSNVSESSQDASIVPYGRVFSPEMDITPEPRHSRVISPLDDVNWPLANPSNTSLPNVPEEEETNATTALPAKSRVSVQSNNSLRGSQSVPLLRELSLRKEKEPRRPASGASDTLGRLDMSAAQRAWEATIDEDEATELGSLGRENWEDDIDYCYEHAAEADCDYAWDRPSCDISREEDATPMDHRARDTHPPCVRISPSMLTPGLFDVPALSPASQLSIPHASEAVTPTTQAMAKSSSNFSLPRYDFSRPKPQLPHLRSQSDMFNFHDCQGITLSPSLLIPNDFQQQMLATSGAAADDDIIPTAVTRDFSYHAYEGSTLSMDTSTLLIHPRTSGSTMESSSGSSRQSTFELRHISTASGSTDFTRFTRSTSSLDMDSFLLKRDSSGSANASPVEMQPPQLQSQQQAEWVPPVPPRAEGRAMPTLLEDEACEPFPTTHGSEPNLLMWAAAQEGGATAGKSVKDPIQLRRQRGRTASLGTPPPAGQYALFPSVHITGTRI